MVARVVIPGGKASRPQPISASRPSRWRKAQAAYRRFGTLTVIALLVATGCLAIVRFSPWPFLDTVKHILAVRNCAAVRAVGLAPARRDDPDYWPKHDVDSDGIACEPWHSLRPY